MTSKRLSVLGLLAVGVASALSVSAASIDPWAELLEMRDQLRADSPLTAAFEQSFVPSGFSTGDSESGTLYLDLPKCLRFEYREPFPKNFLLCGDWVYTWNPNEPSGRRFLVEDSEAEGIDLLRLEVAGLRKRYRAEFADSGASTETIRLLPTGDDTEIREARVELERLDEPASGAKRRLIALSYEDRSGNRTRFEIGEPSGLESRTDFSPPPLAWLDD